MEELTMQDMVLERHKDIGERDTPPVPPPSGPALPVSAQQAPATSPDARHYAFEFTGNGAEYFRIWVVNVLLSFATLGIYSAWAKVRRQQYFYRNTRLAGAIFDYRGNPKAILKGRILALVLVVAYNLASQVSLKAVGAVLLILMLVAPWLLARAFRFNLANSTYRNLRFRFQGTVADAYRTLSIFPIMLGVTIFVVWSLVVSFGQRPGIGTILLVALLPLGLVALVPLAHYMLKRYQHDNAYFGVMPFFFHARAGQFFKIYGKTIVVNMVAGMVFSLLLTVTVMVGGFQANGRPSTAAAIFIGAVSIVAAYVLYQVSRSYLDSRVQNLVWDQTELGSMHFESKIRMRELMGIRVSNMFLIALTLGLYKPFAAVRLARYRLACLSLVAEQDLEEFLADHAAADDGAAGEEVADFFDIDIAL